MARARREQVSDEELDRILDQFEESAITGQRERMQPLTERLWHGRTRVPEVLTRRLESGRSRMPPLAFEILGGFAGERTPEYLERVAEAPAAGDLVRFEARRRFLWPERGEAKARLAFLASLEDDRTTLVSALLMATEGQPFPPNSEVFQEVLKYLLAMPSERAVEVLEAAAEELGREVGWLFRGLLHARGRTLREVALEQIVAVGDRGARGAIDRALQATRTARLRTELEAAKLRLQFRTVGAEPEEVRAMPPVHSAYLSIVDGDGGQVAILLRQHGGGVYLLSQMFFNEEFGIKDSWGINFLPQEAMEGMYGMRKGRLVAFGPGEDRIDLIEVDPPALRGALELAFRSNVANRHGLPPAFEVWEPLFHDQDPPADDEPTVIPELDDARYADRADLYRQSGRLGEHPFFEHWFFNPPEILGAISVAPSPTDRRVTDRQFRPLIARLVDEGQRRRLRQRLRRQAWLLDRTGDQKTRDLALAAAARLAEGAGADLSEHPFLRAMILLSLGNAFGLKFTAPNP